MYPAELIDFLIRLAGLLLTFGFGWGCCRFAHRHDAKRAADRAWRMSEIRNRHTD